MTQKLLFDDRIAILKEVDVGYDVVNTNEIMTKDSINLCHSGICKSRKEFEDEVKRCYGLENVRWIN